MTCILEIFEKSNRFCNPVLTLELQYGMVETFNASFCCTYSTLYLFCRRKLAVSDNLLMASFFLLKPDHWFSVLLGCSSGWPSLGPVGILVLCLVRGHRSYCRNWYTGMLFCQLFSVVEHGQSHAWSFSSCVLISGQYSVVSILLLGGSKLNVILRKHQIKCYCPFRLWTFSTAMDLKMQSNPLHFSC